MSVLESIRKKSGLLVVTVGLALLAFVLTDFLNSGTSLFREDPTIIGTVNGKEIDYRTFDAQYRQQLEVYKQQSGNNKMPEGFLANMIQNNLWNQEVDKVIYEQKGEAIGVEVSSEDIWQAIIKMPEIAQSFVDTLTGGVNESALKNYVTYIKENSNTNQDIANRWLQWLQMEQSIKNNLKKQGVLNLLAKSYAVSEVEALVMGREKKERLDAEFVFKPYADAEKVEVLSKEMENYIAQNPDDFQREARKSIRYVLQEIKPSLDDKATLEKGLETLIKDLVEINKETGKKITMSGFKNISLEELPDFVTDYSDKPYRGFFFHKNEVDEEVKSWLKKAKVGDVLPPYEKDNTFRLTKLIATKVIPDSVKVSHILLTYKGVNQKSLRTKEEAIKVADSLLTVIKTEKESFENVAFQFGEDASKNRKGDLGWIGLRATVPAFETHIFGAKIGKIAKIETQFGVHLVKVTKRKKPKKAYQLATVVRDIEASEETYNDAYQKITKVAKRDINQAELGTGAAALNMETQKIDYLTVNEPGVTGVQDSRDIIRWIHEPKRQIGDIKIFEKENLFIAVLVYDSEEAGLAQVEEVEFEVRPILEKQKRKQILLEQWSAEKGSDLKKIAEKNELEVQTSSAISFKNPTVGGVGTDPEFVGALFGMKKGKIYGPIAGEKGVYFAKVLSRVKVEKLPEGAKSKFKTELEAKQNSNGNQQMVAKSLRKNAEVVDKRSNFY